MRHRLREDTIHAVLVAACDRVSSARVLSSADGCSCRRAAGGIELLRCKAVRLTFLHPHCLQLAAAKQLAAAQLEDCKRCAAALVIVHQYHWYCFCWLVEGSQATRWPCLVVQRCSSTTSATFVGRRMAQHRQAVGDAIFDGGAEGLAALVCVERFEVCQPHHISEAGEL